MQSLLKSLKRLRMTKKRRHDRTLKNEGARNLYNTQDVMKKIFTVL